MKISSRIGSSRKLGACEPHFRPSFKLSETPSRLLSTDSAEFGRTFLDDIQQNEFLQEPVQGGMHPTTAMLDKQADVLVQCESGLHCKSGDNYANHQFRQVSKMS
jgi:hypothetical protein